MRSRSFKVTDSATNQNCDDVELTMTTIHIMKLNLMTFYIKTL